MTFKITFDWSHSPLTLDVAPSSEPESRLISRTFVTGASSSGLRSSL
jgi:hypothetical protein